MQMDRISQELTVVSQAWNTARSRAFWASAGRPSSVPTPSSECGRPSAGTIGPPRPSSTSRSSTAVRIDCVEWAEWARSSPTSGPGLTGSSGMPDSGRSASSVPPLLHHRPGLGDAADECSRFYAGWANQELKDFKPRCLRRPRDSSQPHDGQGAPPRRSRRHAAGVSISITIEQREAGGGSGRRDLVVTFHVLKRPSPIAAPTAVSSTSRPGST